MFSVIMPAFNAGNTISDAIDSVLKQTLSDWELIIVDDASSDNTKEICAKYSAEDPRIRVYDNKLGKGAAGARNYGLYLSKNRYKCFLDSDDLWLSNKLKIQKESFERTGASFIYGDYVLISEFHSGHLSAGSYKKFKAPTFVDFNRLLRNCPIGCLTVALDSRKVGDVAFPETDKEDYALWLKLAENGVRAVNVGEVVAAYRIQSKSLSSNKVVELFRQKSVLERFLPNKPIKSFFCLVYYAISGLFKYRFLKKYDVD